MSYTPSVLSGSKNSHTPSLLIRNNLHNIDKISPYNYNSKHKKLGSILSSNSSLNNKLSNSELMGYSPVQKYRLNKRSSNDHSFKIDRKRNSKNIFDYYEYRWTEK